MKQDYVRQGRREGRWRGPRDVLLLLRALPLARRAQRVTDTPLPQVVASLAGVRGPRWPEPLRLALAAARATARWARWFGGLDTCLTRSLVTGALLARRGEVMLHVGFRPNQAERMVDGHAWVTVDGEPVGADGHLAGDRYDKVLSLSFDDGGGSR